MHWRSASAPEDVSTGTQLVGAHPAPAVPSGPAGRAWPAVGRLPWTVAAAVLLSAAFVAGQLWMQQGWLQTGPNNDFLTFYSAGGADFYSPGAAIEGTRAYLRPPFHAMLLAPLRWMTYPSAYLLWQVLMLWCVAGFVAWWRPPGTAAALCAAAISAPLFFALIRGQDSALLLLSAAGCLLCVRANQPFRAGLWLSVMAIQPWTLLAAPLMLVARRQWGVLKGLAAGLAALTGVSFAYAGWDWPWRLAAAWGASEAGAAAAMPNLMGAAAWLGLEAWTVLPAAILLAVAVYCVGRRESFAAGLGCTLAAALLLAPRAHLEDCVLLLPAALTLLAEKQVWLVRSIALLSLTPIGFAMQGAAQPTPAAVGLAAALLLTAAALPSERRSAQRGQVLQLGLS